MKEYTIIYSDNSQVYNEKTKQRENAQLTCKITACTHTEAVKLAAKSLNRSVTDLMQDVLDIRCSK